MKKRHRESGRFDQLMTKLLRVSHEELKSKLDAEKEAKKRKKSKQSFASREATDRA